MVKVRANKFGWIKMNKANKKREILKAKIGFISLCPAGANTIHTIFKADGKNESIELATISKDMDEQGIITCVVYAPNMVDSQGDMASAAVIKDFAYDFAKNGGDIDIRHNEKALSREDIFIAETTIIQKGDMRFADMKDYDGNSVDVTGGWGVILKIEDENLKKLYRSGEWGGISMGGMMMTKDISEDSKLIKVLKDLLGINNNSNKLKQKTDKTETDMDLTKENITDIAKAVIEANAIVTAETEKIAKEAAVKAAKEGPKLGLGYPLPKIKDNATDEDRMTHLKTLKMYELSEKVDPSDYTAIFKFEETCKEIAASKDLAETIKKQEGSTFERFFKTNQEAGDVTNGSNGEMTMADKILKEMDEEDEKAKKVA